MRRRTFIGLLGSAAAWTMAARAQQPRMPVIGFLNSQTHDEWAAMLGAFRQGLNEAGFIEGQNVTIEFRWAENQLERLPALATDLVRRNVTVIVTSAGDPPTHAAKAVTNTIPIVFIVGDDPVAAGLVASLGHPGGNLTGLTLITATLELKRLEFLLAMVPSLTEVAVLANPRSPRFKTDTNIVQTAGQSMALRTRILSVASEGEFGAAFASIRQQGMRGVLVLSDPLFFSRRDQLVALAAAHSVPAIYNVRELVVSGGLMSYGTSLPSVYRQVATLTAKVLRGVKPSDIPVEQPTKFEFVINLKTAKALGLDVPPMLLARADEVIE
jgi:ABC-type uncharacterized transport system substrate-binding protein